MIETDGVESAKQTASAPTDSRVRQYFDVDKEVGTAYKKLFGLTKTAWDMFLVYGADVDWEIEQPPEPTFYMHQMNTEHGSDPTKILDPEEFKKRVEDILAGLS